MATGLTGCRRCLPGRAGPGRRRLSLCWGCGPGPAALRQSRRRHRPRPPRPRPLKGPAPPPPVAGVAQRRPAEALRQCCPRVTAAPCGARFAGNSGATPPPRLETARHQDRARRARPARGCRRLALRSYGSGSGGGGYRGHAGPCRGHPPATVPARGGAASTGPAHEDPHGARPSTSSQSPAGRAPRGGAGKRLLPLVDPHVAHGLPYSAPHLGGRWRVRLLAAPAPRARLAGTPGSREAPPGLGPLSSPRAASTSPAKQPLCSWAALGGFRRVGGGKRGRCACAERAGRERPLSGRVRGAVCAGAQACRAEDGALAPPVGKAVPGSPSLPAALLGATGSFVRNLGYVPSPKGHFPPWRCSLEGVGGGIGFPWVRQSREQPARDKAVSERAGGLCRSGRNKTALRAP